MYKMSNWGDSTVVVGADAGMGVALFVDIDGLACADIAVNRNNSKL
jgi:hypothetical protein